MNLRPEIEVIGRDKKSESDSEWEYVLVNEDFDFDDEEYEYEIPEDDEIIYSTKYKGSTGGTKGRRITLATKVEDAKVPNRVLLKRRRKKPKKSDD